VTALPEGVHLELDPTVRRFRRGSVLTGGHPGRLFALTDEGIESLARLTGEGPLSEADRNLGRRLVTAGLAHPRHRTDTGVDPTATATAVTIVVPTRDRSELLDRCLDSLGDAAPIVVVDDGSVDPAGAAAVCARHGARLVRHTDPQGPGAARNRALDLVETELVAFVDSDCTVTDGWLSNLVGMFDDPMVGAVAPRVRPRPRPGDRSALARYAEARSPLDMGGGQGEVGPERKIRYVPTAALVTRRSALADGFDPDLRVGEDVDLIWRMGDAGWHVRLVPTVTVWHHEPTTWRGWLRRRLRYGTSAGPLSRRHPGLLAPVELRPWPAAVAAAALAGRGATAGALLLASALLTAGRVRHHDIPFRIALRWSATSAGWTVVGLGHAFTTLAWPALLVGATRRRRWARTGALLVLAPALVDWWQRRPELDPPRWAAACIADDVSYGIGIWIGCIRSRSLGPLVPSVRSGR
jgi:mycofactocin system glycosyltransferase